MIKETVLEGDLPRQKGKLDKTDQKYKLKFSNKKKNAQAEYAVEFYVSTQFTMKRQLVLKVSKAYQFRDRVIEVGLFISTFQAEEYVLNIGCFFSINDFLIKERVVHKI